MTPDRRTKQARLRPTFLTADRITVHEGDGTWDGTLVDAYVTTAAETYGESTAIVDGETLWSYSRIAELVDRFAGALADLGVQPGDVVSWQLPNWIEGVIAHLSAIRLGAVSNPIVPIYRERELSFIVRESGSKVLIVPEVFRRFDHAALAHKLAHEIPSLEHVIVVRPEQDSDDSFESLLARDTEPLVEVPRSANDICLLMYTSGTTSDPKGALHTHNTLNYDNRSIIELFSLDHSDTMLMPSPITHITGLLYGVQMPFMIGMTAVLQDVWEPRSAARLMAEHHCTFAGGATPFLSGILDHAAEFPALRDAIRIFGCGGADVPPDLIERAAVELDCVTFRSYGSTECPTTTAAGFDDPPWSRARTDGRGIADVEIRVAGESGQVLPAGREGELEVWGPELFVGYLDPELNDAAFVADGWFRTGDLGVVDETGFVTITGRKKDIILRGGENISAKEIEDLFYTHPDIAEIAVVGKPDPVMVERICAFVVPRDGHVVTKEGLSEFLLGLGMARQKTPEFVVIVDELPRTASGKVQKHLLRRTFADE